MLRNLEQEEKLKQRVAEATDPVGQILLGAADYIERYGWSDRGAQGSKGEVCTLIAIKRVAERAGDPCGLSRGGPGWQACTRFVDRMGLPPNSIIHWNDSVCRSKEQAVAALRYAGGRQP